MEIINRSALVVYSKENMLSWVNSLESMKDEDDLSIEEINAEPSVFLIPEFEDEESAYLYIEENKNEIFKMMVMGWAEDDSQSVDYDEENFYEWFDVLVTPIVNDMIFSPIQKEEMDS